MMDLIIVVAFLGLTMIIGSLIERSHFKRIEKRELEFQRMPVLSGDEYPTDNAVIDAKLVTGSVVVSIDYFKRFLAGLRNVFGGEVRSYVSLLDRGRREAILRMKEEYPDADLIINFRVETSSVSKGEKKQVGSTEVFAYGTAIKFADQAA